MIEKWYKKEGDLIKRDEVICDIRTPVSCYLQLFSRTGIALFGEIT